MTVYLDITKILICSNENMFVLWILSIIVSKFSTDLRSSVSGTLSHKQDTNINIYEIFYKKKQ